LFEIYPTKLKIMDLRLARGLTSLAL